MKSIISYFMKFSELSTRLDSLADKTPSMSMLCIGFGSDSRFILFILSHMSHFMSLNTVK